MGTSKKKSSSVGSTAKKLNKLDKLILKLDYLENTFYGLPKNINSSIKKFIQNNKYIIIAVVIITLASLGYKTYNYTKNTLAPSGERINKVIENLTTVVYSDDSQLNDYQRFIKHLYLYSTKVPTSPETERLYKLYATKVLSDAGKIADPVIQAKLKDSTNYLINDTIPKLDPILKKKVDEVLNQTKLKVFNEIIPEAKRSFYDYSIGSVSNVAKTAVDAPISLANSVSSYIASMFVSNTVTGLKELYSRKDKDILLLCYLKYQDKTPGKIKGFDEFLENIDLEDQLIINNLDSCYSNLESLLKKFSDPVKAKDCLALGYSNIYTDDKKTLLNFLANYYGDDLKKFEDCYYT